MSSEVIRWGILGTGGIAHKFAHGLAVLDDAALVAVGSRRQDTADAFGSTFGVPGRYATYEALANDPEVDVIYVSTPHPFHYENTMMCLDAGKAVLCEKPFTINAAETEALINRAREKNLFLMEAMWTRFIPAIVKVRELITEGVIGEPRFLQADFSFHHEFDLEHRFFNLDLGGGALLDLGIYPISLASMVFGKQPTHIHSDAYIGDTGADYQSAYIFRYDGIQMAAMMAGYQTEMPREAAIGGDKGTIRVHKPFWVSEGLTVTTIDGSERVINMPKTGNGYNYQAAHVGECLRARKTESDRMSLDESLAIMHTLDRIRAQWNFKYPGEK